MNNPEGVLLDVIKTVVERTIEDKIVITVADLHKRIDEAINSEVCAVDFDTKIEEALNDFDFDFLDDKIDAAVKNSSLDYKIEKLVDNALENLDFADKAEKAIDDALEEADLDNKAERAIDDVVDKLDLKDVAEKAVDDAMANRDLAGSVELALESNVCRNLVNSLIDRRLDVKLPDLVEEALRNIIKDCPRLVEAAIMKAMEKVVNASVSNLFKAVIPVAQPIGTTASGGGQSAMLSDDGPGW